MFAKAIIAATCIVILSGSACRGDRIINAGDDRANADANHQSLTLEQISHLDQKMFERSLPRLRELLEQTDSTARTGEETMSALTRKLRQTPESAPDYWSTVLRFLQFASGNIALKAPTHEPQKKLSEILSVGIMRGIREYDQIIVFDEGFLGNGEFTNCRIIFTPKQVQMQNVVFKVCAFEFPTTDAPSPYLRKLCRILLSSDLSSVSIPTL